VKRGHLGQKKNGGFYDYDEKRIPTPSAVAGEAAELAAPAGVENTGPISAEEIVARLLHPAVNEGAKVLEEGIGAPRRRHRCRMHPRLRLASPYGRADVLGRYRRPPGGSSRAYGEGVEPAKLGLRKTNRGSFTC
jgi:hypothetical protein